MIISQLLLTHFRNHAKKSFSFSPQTTIIIGPNASGKTNVLEALYLLATGKSFRADTDREMIGFSKELARVVGQIKTTTEDLKLEIILTTGQVQEIKTPLKSCKINGLGKRMLDFAGNLKTVLFWPEDLELVTDSPSYRRRYLDFVLIQTDREYRRCLISYEKGLRQRNHLLEAIRDRGVSRSQLLFWDQLLIKNGEYISKKREEYIGYLNKFQISNFKSKSNLNNQILNYQIEYDPSFISPSRLEQYKQEEVAAASTLVGPHRDDIKFKIKDQKSKIKDDDEYRNLSQFGSRGEQRLAILWLKLGELSYIEHCDGQRPILLLDDIFSELDHPHREIVFDLMGKQQTIMTAADPHFIDKTKLQGVEIIEF